MNVLVVGGAGYIGAHVAKALHRSGHNPVVYDSLRTNRREAVKWGELVVGDVRDTEALTRALKDYSIEAVVHLAGVIEVGESVREPLAYYDANTAGSLSLAKAMVAGNVRYLVFSSTAAVYGNPPSRDPLKETLPLQPVNPYGWSKLAAERIFLDTAATGAFAAVPLRYFNASGADPDGELGEYHDPETHIIPRACLAVLGKVPELQLFGTDWDTPDGTCIRDYIHVSDLAVAHVKAIEYLVAGGESRAFNLGNGEGQSVRAIIDAVSRVSGTKVPYKEAPRRDGDPAVLVADPSDANRLLGWKPKYTDLEFMVKTAWDSFKNRP